MCIFWIVHEQSSELFLVCSNLTHSTEFNLINLYRAFYFGWVGRRTVRKNKDISHDDKEVLGKSPNHKPSSRNPSVFRAPTFYSLDNLCLAPKKFKFSSIASFLHLMNLAAVRDKMCVKDFFLCMLMWISLVSWKIVFYVLRMILLLLFIVVEQQVVLSISIAHYCATVVLKYLDGKNIDFIF